MIGELFKATETLRALSQRLHLIVGSHLLSARREVKLWLKLWRWRRSHAAQAERGHAGSAERSLTTHAASPATRRKGSLVGSRRRWPEARWRRR